MSILLADLTGPIFIGRFQEAQAKKQEDVSLSLNLSATSIVDRAKLLDAVVETKSINVNVITFAFWLRLRFYLLPFWVTLASFSFLLAPFLQNKKQII